MSGARAAAARASRRLRAWWDALPLVAVFSAYLVAYLVAATALSYAAVSALLAGRSWALAVVSGGSAVPAGDLYLGPYVYDAASGELVAASELVLVAGSAQAAFVPARSGSPSGNVTFATVADVRSGVLELRDWGLNYLDEAQREEVLRSGEKISADELSSYDREQRAKRFDAPAAAGLAGASGASNVAYVASLSESGGFLVSVAHVLSGLAPFVVYGGLGWIAFRRFYRRHIEGPVAGLEAAAGRIAARDLDFSVGPARGRELGRLARSMEGMRAALLVAQRELWRTAQDRRRLNAAFAHDLRTPLTVLKGTLEMAAARAGEGDARAACALLPGMSDQVGRLEAYVEAMGGLGRLEERPVRMRPLPAADLAASLDRRAREAAAACAPGPKACGPEVATAWPAPAAGGGTVWADPDLMGEVLENLVGNACRHARRLVRIELGLVGPGGRTLVCAVRDDGEGFSPEALRRGCEPFFAESKAQGHLGLGLNIASVLCRLHGGSLSLSNAAGGGALVRASFDVAPPRNEKTPHNETTPTTREDA